MNLFPILKWCSRVTIWELKFDRRYFMMNESLTFFISFSIAKGMNICVKNILKWYSWELSLFFYVFQPILLILVCQCSIIWLNCCLITSININDVLIFNDVYPWKEPGIIVCMFECVLLIFICADSKVNELYPCSPLLFCF